MITEQVIITGPESSGKSTLAKTLSVKLKSNLVLEYARNYLSELDRQYEKSDLELIAKEQKSRIEKAAQSGHIISDTGPLVLKVWFEEKFEAHSEYIDEWFIKDKSLYLLCKPDIDWKYDPLRENPNDRDRLFEKYYIYLSTFEKRFIVISGKNRLDKALDWISKTKV